MRQIRTTHLVLFGSIYFVSVCVLIVQHTPTVEKATTHIWQPATNGSADVSQFNIFLDSCATMSLDSFLETYSTTKYVTKLTFNPTKSTYFDMFMDKSKRPKNDHYAHDDFALSSSQLDAFTRNGFVVTNPENSFSQAYYKIYNNDLPVLITTDSVLHAFHKSYDTILQELEKHHCVPVLRRILSGMREELKTSHAKFTQGPFQRSFVDLDLFLTVALYLLDSEDFSTNNSLPPILCSEKEINALLQACKNEQSLDIALFGNLKNIDFTQFKPRGHYTKLPELRQYFRAMTWLGKVDMTVAGDGSNLQQLGSAVLIHMMLAQNPQIEELFHSFNRIVEYLVGQSNSLDANQLGLFLNQTLHMKDHASLNSEEALTKLQNQILATNLGDKKYNNGPWRSFTFLGKRFTIDSWAQSKMVTNDGIGANVIRWQGKTVPRHVTSAVEVAFSVFGNNDSVPILHQRISQTNPENVFRDGLIYHPYLVATRNTIDNLSQETWNSSIYTFWLSALRRLSGPLRPEYPQAMRTQAYAMKKLNTQLGSWAQLRHDNILYVEQAVRFLAGCDYPDGFVEPFVEFWEAMESLCTASAEIMFQISKELPKTERVSVAHNLEQKGYFFRTFADIARVLRNISAKELLQEPLDADQQQFIKTMVEQVSVGSGKEVEWTGWYPSLYYGGESDLLDSDTIVCDVFSNPPSEDDPGCVVHQGLGKPRRIIMAVDNGESLATYAGAVYDYYEFELRGLQRMNDEEWSKKFENGASAPQPPEWTSSYLVPE